MEKTKCQFLIIMLILSSVLMVFLNFLIAYAAIQYLKTPDLGMGLIALIFGVFVGYMFAIPATVITIRSVKWARNDKKNKFIVPILLGVTGTLTGILLSNGFDYWLIIAVFSVLLVLSVFMCDNEKQVTLKIDGTTPFPVSEKSINSTFNKVKAIHIAGLILLLFIAIGVFVIPEIQMPVKLAIPLPLGLHFWVTIRFLKKKRSALTAKQIVNIVVLGIAVLLFIAYLFKNKIVSPAVITLFFLLVAVMVYLIFSYKRLKHSSLFKSQTDTGPVFPINDHNL